MTGHRPWREIKERSTMTSKKIGTTGEEYTGTTGTETTTPADSIEIVTETATYTGTVDDTAKGTDYPATSYPYGFAQYKPLVATFEITHYNGTTVYLRPITHAFNGEYGFPDRPVIALSLGTDYFQQYAAMGVGGQVQVMFVPQATGAGTTSAETSAD